MKDIRNIELKLRSLNDRVLLEILDGTRTSEPRQLSSALMEAYRPRGVAALRASVEPVRPVILKCIGFWKGLGRNHDYFQPDWLTQPGCAKEDLKSILAYLGMGHTCRVYLGYDECRFPGCTDGDRIGSTELTDGDWVWPEGLGHHVERHSVILPEEIRAKLRQCVWGVSSADRELALHFRYRGFDYDRTFWIDWSLKVRRTRRFW